MFTYRLRLFLVCFSVVVFAWGSCGDKPGVATASKEDVAKFSASLQAQAQKMKDLSDSYAHLQNEMKALLSALQKATPAQKKQIPEFDALLQKAEAVSGRATFGAAEIVALSGQIATSSQQLQDNTATLELIQNVYKNIYEPKCIEYVNAYERLPALVEQIRSAVSAAGLPVEKVLVDSTRQHGQAQE